MTTRTSPVVDLVTRLERSNPGPYQRYLSWIAPRILPSSREVSILRGEGFGHALHPPLSDLPIGFWTSSAVLDLCGGADSRTAARRLVGAGLLSVLPTALAGLAEWTATSGGDRRVATIHAAANAGAALAYASSFALRGRHHGAGVAAGLLGGGLASAGGYLGGHLAIAKKVGSHDERFAKGAPRT